MKIKTIGILAVMLLISLFANIALGFNVSSMSQDKKEYRAEEEKLKEVEHAVNEGAADKPEVVSSVSEEAENVVKKFFQIQYEYNEKTYKERFEKVKPLVNEKVYGQLTSAGIPDLPKVKVENKIGNIDLYLKEKKNKVSGLILLNSIYSIDGNEGPQMKQVFHIEVGEEDGQLKILALEILGTFAPMAES